MNTQNTWVGLTDEEIEALAKMHFSKVIRTFNAAARAIEAKLREKNAMPANAAAVANGEPVAWATRLNEYAHINWGEKRPEYPMIYEFPLYTTPQPAVPERKPLTDEQIMNIAPVKMTKSMRALVRAIEKAHGIEPELPF